MRKRAQTKKTTSPRPLPIILDRFMAGLKTLPPDPTRAQAIEMLADCCGYAPSNAFVAAASAGEFSPVEATRIGALMTSEGQVLNVLRAGPDTIALPIGMPEVFPNPFGGLVRLKCGEGPVPADVDKTIVHVAVARVRGEITRFHDDSREGLRETLADWCRGRWDADIGAHITIPGADDEIVRAFFREADASCDILDLDIAAAIDGALSGRRSPLAFRTRELNEPMPVRPDDVTRVTATFRPQVWVNDCAHPADPLGPIRWDVTDVFDAMKIADAIDLNCRPDKRDRLRFHRDAPAWVSDWSGPFEVDVAATLTPYLRHRAGRELAAALSRWEKTGTLESVAQGWTIERVDGLWEVQELDGVRRQYPDDGTGATAFARAKAAGRRAVELAEAVIDWQDLVDQIDAL